MNLLNKDRLKDIAAETRCATCKQGRHPAVHTAKTGQWVHLYEDGSFIGPCFDPLRAELLAMVRTAQYEAALARDTAFWLDCQWDKRGEGAKRGADHCLLEGTHVCALCKLADAKARYDELNKAARRYRRAVQQGDLDLLTEAENREWGESEEKLDRPPQ